jgi:hypothetical protein
MAITVDKELASRALEDVTARLCSLLRSQSSDDEKAMAVGDWTVKHVAAHPAGGGELFPAYARDEGPQIPTDERSDYRGSASEGDSSAPRPLVDNYDVGSLRPPLSEPRREASRRTGGAV